MLTSVLTTALSILSKFLAPLSALWITYTKGRTDEQNKNLKESYKRLANRPRTDDDVIIELRAWSKRLKRKGK